MKKTISLLLLISVLLTSVFSLSAYAENGVAKTLATKMTFDDMTSLRMISSTDLKAEKNVIYHADYDIVKVSEKIELSANYDHTTGKGKSLRIWNEKAEYNGKYNFARIKFFNAFKDSPFTSSDIGKVYTATLWAYSEKEVEVKLSTMSLANLEGMTGTSNWGGSGKYETIVKLPANKWTQISLSVKLDDIDVFEKNQIGMLTFQLPTADSQNEVYIDDIQVFLGEAPKQIVADIPQINTTIASAYDPADVEKFGEEGAHTKRLLNSLGVLTNFYKAYDAAKVINRGEYASYLSEFLGNKSITGTADMFTDIKDTSMKEKVGALALLKIVNGFGDGTFRPEIEISYIDAVTTMVKFLNYTPYADVKGGYEAGYSSVAQKIGLLDGISANFKDKLTQETFMKLINNFIKVEVFEQIGYGSQAEYTTTDNYTILSQNFDVYKEKGIVEATELSSLSSVSGVSEDSISIGGTIFKVGSSDIDDHLGYNMVYYYKLEGSSEPEIVYSYKSNTNRILKIEAEDIVGIQNSYLVYYNNGKLQKQKINGNESCLVNGIYTVPTSEIFDIDAGSVSMVDNGSGNGYSVIDVDKVEYYVVSSVNPEGVIYDKSRKVLEFDIEDSSVEYSVKSTTGKDVELKNITEWNVLSVRQSKGTNAEKIDIIVSRYKASGKITGLSMKSGTEYEYIEFGNDVVYVSDAFNKNIFGEKNWLNELKLGDAVVLHLDEFGKAVSWTYSDEREFSIGYLVEAGVIGKSLRNSVELRILTSTGMYEEFTLAKKVKLNGEKYKSTDQSVIDALVPGGNVKRQLITYKADATKTITEIDTAGEGDLPEGNNKLHKTIAGKYAYISQGKYFYSQPKTFMLNGKAPAFIIPASEKYMENEEFYNAFSNATSIIEGDKQYNVELYTFGSSYNVADIVVIKNDGFALFEPTNPIVITRVLNAVDEDGTEIKRIVGFNSKDGKTVTLDIDDRRTNAAEFSVGDIVAFSESSGTLVIEDSMSIIKYYVDCKKSGEPVDFMVNGSAYYGRDQYNRLAPYKLEGNNIVFNDINSPGSKETLCAFNAAEFRYYVVEANRKEVREGSVADIMFYDDTRDIQQVSSCYVFVYKGKPGMVVIYN